MKIRPATPGDCRDIAELHVESWRFAYGSALSATYLAGDIVSDRMSLWRSRLSRPHPDQLVLVAEGNGLITGFACCFIAGPEAGALLDNIHVRADNHRRGIGSRLLGAVASQVAIRCPTGGLCLWVLQDNRLAQNFYEKHGAKYLESDVWNAPGGTQVPRFKLGWEPGKFPSGAL